MNTIGIKLVVVGAAAAGKTSIIHRFIHRKFERSYRATIGADFLSKSVQLSSKDAKINLQMWDLGGNEKYSSIAPLYFRGAHAVLIVFDITDPHSITAAQKWYERAQNELRKYDYMADIMFVANKCDAKDKCDYSELENTCVADVVGFREVSAKTGDNIDKIVIEMLELAWERRSRVKEAAKKTVALREMEIDDSCCGK